MTSRTRVVDGVGGEPVELEVYLRSLAPCGAIEYQERILRRASDLAASRAVAGVAVYVWSDGVAPGSAAAETPAGRAVLDRVAAVHEWAERTEASVAPFFETQAVHSALAEFRGGRLAFVSPCLVDGERRTVLDHLATLGAPPGNGDLDAPRAAG